MSGSGMTVSDFYHTTAWRRFRKAYLAFRLNRDGAYIDDMTKEQIMNPWDCVLHHVNPITEATVTDPDVTLNAANIMLLTHASHNRIHEKFGNRRHAVYLVWGAPKSGKSLWTDENASQGDLVVEMERIYRMMGSEGIDTRYKAVAFRIWDVLIDSVKTRSGRWRDAYIVGTFPWRADRERLLGQLGGEEVFIDVDEDVCLNRCSDENEMLMVHDWFEKQRSQGEE